MIELRKGRPGDEEQILDFANYVFTVDFPTLIPKVYARPDHAPIHHIAWENGRIRGLVGVWSKEYRLAGMALKCGFIGTVSCHPYHREKGIMRQLMLAADEEMRNDGTDLSLLGGQRQRYQTYGYDKGGCMLGYEVCRRNLKGISCAENLSLRPFTQDSPQSWTDKAWQLYSRQGLQIRDKEELIVSLRTWDAKALCILVREEPVGYLSANGERIQEWELEKLELLPQVLKLWMEENRLEEGTVLSGVYDMEKNAALDALSENTEFRYGENMKIYNYPRVLQALLTEKNRYYPLGDGRCVLGCGEAGNVAITVQDGEVSAQMTDGKADAEFSELEIVHLLTGPFGYMSGDGRMRKLPEGWFPAPLVLSPADEF